MSLLRGCGLLLNFASGRESSELDLKRLSETLKDVLNFEPTCHQFYDDAEEDAVKVAINRFIADNNFEELDYVIVSLFCHGEMDEIFQNNTKRRQFQKALLDPLFEVKALRGKLKWAIFQMCSGKYDCHISESDSPIDREIKLKQEYCMKSFPSQQGSLSYRFVGEGSPFIKYLCKNLKKAKEMDLLSILDATREDVKEEYRKRFPNDTKFPVPSNRYNFTQPFYFTSGFEQPNE